MDLIKFRRWGSRSSASKADQANSREPDRQNSRPVFGNIGGRRSGGTIRPTTHETIDDYSTINTVADSATDDADDNESVIEIFRTGPNDGSPRVRGATPSSNTSFRAFLNSTPRSGPSRPRFPGVTVDTETIPATDTNVPPRRPPGRPGDFGPMPGFRMPPGGKSLDDTFSSLLDTLKEHLESLGIDGDDGPKLRRKEGSSRKGSGTQTWEPLHFAAQRGSARLCQSLLEHGAHIEAKTESGWTPMFYAAQGGHLDVCRVLVNHGAQVNVCSSELSSTRTPLIQAAQNGYLDVVKLLVSNGADVNLPGPQGGPLFFGAIAPSVEVCEFLIANGADVNGLDENGRTPLLLAAAQGSPEVVRVLLRHGALVTARSGRSGTVLHYATGRNTPNMLETIEALLDAGADVNAIDDDGDTPLIQCMINGRADVAELLIRHGADLNVINKLGVTALTGCAGKGIMNVIEVLLKHGADVNLCSEARVTALHLAAAQDDPAVVRRLLEAGANPHLAGRYELTPLHVASQNDNEEILIAMLEHGVNLNPLRA
ncbi:ankyrin repeat-containing domain protein [Podospora didyma]|uniref:Ankyrin repeat-containing domain protein n=1 Tax=Podospora didyma TaxID=330526 RepID=A0AAE0U4J6_9PEZI|nr:ankyrin repeat-containing domain protein [Podospora didyma]